MSWAFYALCNNPSIQTALRKEIHSICPLSLDDMPSFDEVNSLPFLDAVVRETLRLYAPAPGAMRIVAEDSIIPLGKPFKDINGKIQNSIQSVFIRLFFLNRFFFDEWFACPMAVSVAKRTPIYIPIRYINRCKDTWGPDGYKFNPYRWMEEGKDTLPEGARDLPSLTSPTFLAGSYGCIGFRFTIIEWVIRVLLWSYHTHTVLPQIHRMKAVIFSLIRVMEFKLAVPESDIRGDVRWAYSHSRKLVLAVITEFIFFDRIVPSFVPCLSERLGKVSNCPSSSHRSSWKIDFWRFRMDSRVFFSVPRDSGCGMKGICGLVFPSRIQLYQYSALLYQTPISLEIRRALRVRRFVWHTQLNWPPYSWSSFLYQPIRELRDWTILLSHIWY